MSVTDCAFYMIVLFGRERKRESARDIKPRYPQPELDSGFCAQFKPDDPATYHFTFTCCVAYLRCRTGRRKIKFEIWRW